MTYEQRIILKTLNEVQEALYNLITKSESTLKNDGSIEDNATKLQIETLEVVDLVLGMVAQKNGIKINVEKREDK